MKAFSASPNVFTESQIASRLLPSPPAPVRDLKDTGQDDNSNLAGSACELDELGMEGTRLYPLPPKSRENKVLAEDMKTPDNHVARDSRLIRLTGVHPFNVEAPLSDLYDEGFLTSENLHFVRNHGPVPRVPDETVLDWEFSVEGLVEIPTTMTLRTLIRDYEQQTYPITLVCAGNRRKEQNMVRKTKGFSWGAAGLSTALWTGVALRDILARAGPKKGARYVYFEGADKLPNGCYGTSVKLNWAMDLERGILVAHRMNGDILHPDHGKPMRIVIPGQIGGRSVKWLRRIVVTATPSDSWYHVYDNRVLPTMITPEASVSLPDTWKDERYAIYDLNTNSAICYPAHNEKISLLDLSETYRFRGYAYSGGGKRVTRLEVTLDQGNTWTLANLTYPEDTYRLAAENEWLYGGRLDLSRREASYCWCFWHLEVPISELGSAKDVMIRAMDDSMMIQPRDIYWNVLGMMNNPWFRIVVHRDGRSVTFEHPAPPQLSAVGWMDRVKRAGGNLTNGFWGEAIPGYKEGIPEATVKEICMISKDVKSSISSDDLQGQGGEEKPWFVVKGHVYDGTKFLEGHPGGAASIVGAAGQDVTDEFMEIHSDNAKAMMPDYHIGSLDEKTKAELANTVPEAQSDDMRPVFLQSKVWSKALLAAKRKISSNTRIFTFKLTHEAQTIGLPTGQHVLMRLRDPVTREAIVRAYTPISEATDVGFLHVLVKIYYDTPEEKGGKMTQSLDSIPVGHWVEFKGPIGKIEYRGKGVCSINGKDREVRRFIMICGGSGVTPIFQVFRAVMKDRKDPTQCLVLDGNRQEEDILCKEELDTMADMNKEKCKVVYSLTKPGPNWQGFVGRMDKSFLEQHVGSSKVGNDDLILVCGPPSMEKSIHHILLDLGWTDNNILFF